eukprot:320184-Chlamydomonas_euryale.AAC.1
MKGGLVRAGKAQFKSVCANTFGGGRRAEGTAVDGWAGKAARAEMAVDVHASPCVFLRLEEGASRGAERM